MQVCRIAIGLEHAGDMLTAIGVGYSNTDHQNRVESGDTDRHARTGSGDIDCHAMAGSGDTDRHSRARMLDLVILIAMLSTM